MILGTGIPLTGDHPGHGVTGVRRGRGDGVPDIGVHHGRGVGHPLTDQATPGTIIVRITEEDRVLQPVSVPVLVFVPALQATIGLQQTDTVQDQEYIPEPQVTVRVHLRHPAPDIIVRVQTPEITNIITDHTHVPVVTITTIPARRTPVPDLHRPVAPDIPAVAVVEIPEAVEVVAVAAGVVAVTNT